MNWTSASTQQQHSSSQHKAVIDPDPAHKGSNELLGVFVNLLANLSTMKSVWQERRKLQALRDDQLEDIGVCPRAARLESKRSFFDIPEERRQPLFTKTRSKFKR